MSERTDKERLDFIEWAASNKATWNSNEEAWPHRFTWTFDTEHGGETLRECIDREMGDNPLNAHTLTVEQVKRLEILAGADGHPEDIAERVEDMAISLRAAKTLLETACKYLAHPDVRAMNFALNSGCVADRINAFLLSLGNK